LYKKNNKKNGHSRRSSVKKQEVTTPLTTGALQKSDIEEKQQLRFSKLRPRAHFPTLDSKRGFPIGHDRPVRT